MQRVRYSWKIYVNLFSRRTSGEYDFARISSTFPSSTVNRDHFLFTDDAAADDGIDEIEARELQAAKFAGLPLVLLLLQYAPTTFKRKYFSQCDKRGQ